MELRFVHIDLSHITTINTTVSHKPGEVITLMSSNKSLVYYKVLKVTNFHSYIRITVDPHTVKIN